MTVTCKVQRNKHMSRGLVLKSNLTGAAAVSCSLGVNGFFNFSLPGNTITDTDWLLGFHISNVFYFSMIFIIFRCSGFVFVGLWDFFIILSPLRKLQMNHANKIWFDLTAALYYSTFFNLWFIIQEASDHLYRTLQSWLEFDSGWRKESLWSESQRHLFLGQSSRVEM